MRHAPVSGKDAFPPPMDRGSDRPAPLHAPRHTSAVRVIMSDRLIVEANRRVVGVAMRVPRGFQFFASDPAFTSPQAKVRRRLKAMFGRVTQAAAPIPAAAISGCVTGEEPQWVSGHM